MFNEAPPPTEAQLAEIEKLKESARAAYQRKEESFQRCDTDGFLSQWAAGLGAKRDLRQIEVLKQGGTWQFPVLCDKEGNVIATKIYEFKDQYAPEWSKRTVLRWRLPDNLAAQVGRKWLPTGGKSKVQKQLGFHEESRYFPAVAKIVGSGTGLSGNAWVEVVRKED